MTEDITFSSVEEKYIRVDIDGETVYSGEGDDSEVLVRIFD